MSRYIHISHAWWIEVSVICLLLAITGCTNRAPSLKMLETRAGYGTEYEDEEVALYERNLRAKDSVLARSAPRVAKVYIYPHELPSRDYFWGGFVSLVVRQDEWIFENPEESITEESSAVREIKTEAAKPKRKPARIPSSRRKPGIGT